MHAAESFEMQRPAGDKARNGGDSFQSESTLLIVSGLRTHSKQVTYKHARAMRRRLKYISESKRSTRTILCAARSDVVCGWR
jgi:hypothetical protein